jgi:pilus assembly protein CpaE
MTAVPGAVAQGNLDHYVGVERDVARLLHLGRIRVCVIDYDQNTEEAIWLTERLRSEFPEVYIFAISANSDPQRIIAAMRPGCAEYLLKPIDHQRVLEAFGRAEARQKEMNRSKVRGKVITLLGAKGGTGVTTLAVHLALELAAGGSHKCVLVDRHQALGDASLYLGTGRHQYSFYELAGNRDRLDEELLQGFLLKHSSGLDLLDSPDAVETITGASPAAVELTLSFLAGVYEFVIVDSPTGLSDVTLACIAQSDPVVIVMTAEIPSVRNTVRYIEHLTKLGYRSNSISIVLNRYSKKGPLSEDRIETALGRAISLRVPNSYSDVIRAINTGVPIAPGGKPEFSAAIGKWARELVGKEGGETREVKATAPLRSGLQTLFGKVPSSR